MNHAGAPSEMLTYKIMNNNKSVLSRDVVGKLFFFIYVD